jgi:hypothetical protein
MRRTTGTILGVLAGVGLALWAANPIKAQPATTTVSVTAIAAGDNNIGNVDIASSALPTGASTESTLGSVLTSVQTIAVSTGLLDDGVLAEDAVHASGASGRLVLAVRNDAGTALAADGDYIPLSVDSAGAVRVTGGGGGTQYTEADTDASITGTAVLWEDGSDTLRAVSAAKPLPVSCGDCSGTGVSHVDDAAFTAATDDVVPAAGVFDDTSPDSVNEGDAGALRMSGNRNLYVTIRDAAGNERGLNVNASGQIEVASHAVTNAGTFVVQVDGAALTALQLIDNIVTTEDTASAGGDSGAVVMARQTATPANQAGTEGDYEFLQMSAGRLWTSTTVTGTVTIDSELPAASALADNTSNPTTPSVAAFIMCYDGSTWDRCTQGTTTEATQDGALTVATTIGGVGMARASATEPTNVSADDDAVMLWALRSGALAVTNRASDGDDMTDTTNDALRVNIVAGAAAGGTSITDDAAFTVASSALTPVGGTYIAARDSVTDGDAGAFAMTIQRALYTSLETPLGDSVLNDTLDTVKVSQATAANLNATVVGTGTFAVQVSSLPASTNTIEVVGDAAHDATYAGNPLTIGGYSSAAAPTDVTADGEAVRLWALRNGALAIQPTFSGSLAAVNNGAVSAGTLRVTLANDSTGVLASVGTVTTVSTVTNVATIGTSVTPGTSAAHLGKAEDAAHGSADTGVAVWGRRIDTLATSADTSGDYATLNLNASGALYVAPTGATNGGADGVRYISAGATEDEHAVKTSAGTLYSITATNTNAAVRYLKCEADTAAGTAPGTDTPEIGIAIPGATTGAGFTTTFPVGYSFSTGLTCWLVTGAADSDVAEVAANEIMVFYTVK